MENDNYHDFKTPWSVTDLFFCSFLFCFVLFLFIFFVFCLVCLFVFFFFFVTDLQYTAATSSNLIVLVNYLLYTLLQLSSNLIRTLGSR